MGLGHIHLLENAVLKLLGSSNRIWVLLTAVKRKGRGTCLPTLCMNQFIFCFGKIQKSGSTKIQRPTTNTVSVFCWRADTFSRGSNRRPQPPPHPVHGPTIQASFTRGFHAEYSTPGCCFSSTWKTRQGSSHKSCAFQLFSEKNGAENSGREKAFTQSSLPRRGKLGEE